jgi:hypothetical protein
MTDPYYNVGLTEAEMTELILLIDDEPTHDKPVDEELLSGVRIKLANKRKALRKRVKEGMYSGTT